MNDAIHRAELAIDNGFETVTESAAGTAGHSSCCSELKPTDAFQRVVFETIALTCKALHPFHAHHRYRYRYI